MSTELKDKFDQWCLVELFGHQKIVGKVTESTIAGGAFIRVDVPASNGEKAFTRFYGPSAIYSMSPVTEEIGMELSERYRNTPVSTYELPKLIAQQQTQEDSPTGTAECEPGDGEPPY